MIRKRCLKCGRARSQDHRCPTYRPLASVKGKVDYDQRALPLDFANLEYRGTSSNVVVVMSDTSAMPNVEVFDSHPILWGRSRSCDQVLRYATVSTFHFSIQNSECGVFLHDLSLNGTFVNGMKVYGRKRLYDGSRITLDKQLDKRRKSAALPTFTVRIDKLDALEDDDVTESIPVSPVNSGEINFYEDNKLMRTVKHDRMYIYDKGVYDHTEFVQTSVPNGEVCFFNNGALVRKEFASTDGRHGTINYYNDGKLMRMEFTRIHFMHGTVCFFENDKLIRTEFDGVCIWKAD